MIVEKRDIRTRLSSFVGGGILSLSLLAVSGIVMADEVTQFGQWTVNNGTIDTDLSCQDVNIVCTVLVESNGFRQELVDAGTSGVYIRTIVTDENATGNSGALPFEQESFTPFNSAARASFGFDMNSAVRDTAQGFQSIAAIDQDPFVDANNNQLTLTNINLTSAMNTPEIVSNFNYASNELTGYPDPANNIFGKTLDIDVDVFMDCNGTTTQMGGGGMMGCPGGGGMGGGMMNFMAQQRFVQRDREGWNIDITTGTLIVTPITTAGSMQLDPSVIPVAWNEGDSISTHWIAQADNQGGASFTMNYQSISNLEPGAVDSFADFQDQSSPPPVDPFAWDPVFGPAPPSLNAPQ
ncbi:MAG TPA: hypothetical protein ENJ22_05630 [Gammaproteobacteria bacterium]|nr:hypothetical protein [Gammaproteobacteria bacterium]